MPQWRIHAATPIAGTSECEVEQQRRNGGSTLQVQSLRVWGGRAVKYSVYDMKDLRAQRAEIFAQPAAGADALKDLRARRAEFF